MSIRSSTASLLSQIMATVLVLTVLTACAGSNPPVEPTEPPAAPTPADIVQPTSAPPTSVPPSADDGEGDVDLPGTSWQLVSMGAAGAETTVLDNSIVTVEFSSDGQVTGHGGCNSFGGVYIVQDNTLSINEVVSTLMACADQAITTQEQSFLGALGSAERFEVTDSSLTIWYDGGSSTLNFVPLTAEGASSAIPPATPSQQDQLLPTATVEAASGSESNSIGDATRIEFEPGATTANVSESLPGGTIKEFVVSARAGQSMHVQTIGYGAPVTFTVRGPDGITWSGEPQPSEVYIYTAQTVVTADGDYHVTISVPADASTTRVDAVFTVTDEPLLDTPPMVGPPELVEFANGETVAQRSAMMPSGLGVDRYMFSAVAGQTIEIQVSSADASVNFVVEGPGGSNWEAEPVAGETNLFSLVITVPEDGDYISILTKGEHTPSANYEVVFTLQQA